MRYHDNREQSAELLRMVLPLMSRHLAAFHPLSYAVWYEYAAGLNQPLRTAIDARTARGEQLTDADIQELFDAHVAMRDIESSMKLRARIQEVAEEMGQATHLASEEMGRYNAGLSVAQTRLQREAEAGQVAAVVKGLQADTSRVLDRTTELHQSLRDTSREARRIGVALEGVRGQAHIDPLTGLLARRGLEYSIAEAHPRGLPEGGLLRIEIDQLRSVVAEHGHLLADRVISAVAQVVIASAGIKAVVARLGSGDFAVLLPGIPAATLAEVAERVRGNVSQCRIRRPEGEKEVTEPITVSIGIAPVSEGETLPACLARGDLALARAQAEGGNRLATGGAAQPGS
jgi:diguanylate cyclase